MIRELDVWLFANRVGTLSLAEGHLSFAYHGNWLTNPDAVPLSCSLPLQPEPFDDHQARAFFAGLLPEGRLRQLIAKQLHVSRQNDFALLDAIGGECAGAVTFLESDQAHLPTHAGEIEWLDDQQLASILDELPRRPMLAGKDGLRLSLAGAQDKLPVVYDGHRIGLPLNGYPSTHILKPPIHALDDSVINECYCLELARVMNLQTAEVRVQKAGAHRFLLVKRYDRTIDEHGHAVRLHQEDFCQAMGVEPEMKYQNEGGPDLAACFDLLRRVTRPNAIAVLRLLDEVIFNALIGNHDAHAKNFSLLYTGNSPILAPLYDVLSTAIYPDLTPKMAMKLGSKYTFADVQARHWAQFAEAAGLAGAQTRRRILELARAMPLAAKALQHGTALFAESAVVERIVNLIEERSAATIRLLTAGNGAT